MNGTTIIIVIINYYHHHRGMIVIVMVVWYELVQQRLWRPKTNVPATYNRVIPHTAVRLIPSFIFLHTIIVYTVGVHA